MDKTYINHKTSKAILNSCADELGIGAKDDFASGRFDHAFSSIIECGLLENMILATNNLDKPLSEILTNKKLLLMWHYSRHIFELFFNAANYWRDSIEYSMVLKANYTSCDKEKFPKFIAEDIAVFSLIAIYYGGDAPTYRKMINSKTEKKVTKLLKTDGIKAIMAYCLRSCIAFMSIDDHVVTPALKAIYSGKDNRSINHLGDAVCSSGLSKKQSPPTKSKRSKSVDLSELSTLLRNAK